MEIVRCIFCLKTQVENKDLRFFASQTSDTLGNLTAVCENCVEEFITPRMKEE